MRFDPSTLSSQPSTAADISPSSFFVETHRHHRARPGDGRHGQREHRKIAPLLWRACRLIHFSEKHLHTEQEQNDAAGHFERVHVNADRVVSLQSADGRILEASLDIGVRPKPEPRKKAVRQSVKTQIVFCAPENEDREALQELLAEDRIEPFGAFLTKYGEELEVPADECTYWGEKSDTNGESLLTIEINAGNSQLRAVLKQCRTVDERIKTKERYVRDVVLDCYQYSFELQETPETVREAIGGDADERRRAADIHLNNDKALRIALDELNANRTR
jgi:hypothetical protein